MATTDRKSSMKAFAAALRAFADVVESEDTPPADAKPAPKPKKADAGAPTQTPAGTPAGGIAPADVVNRTSAAAGAGAATGDIMTQARQAAKSYAEVYGREGLKEVLGKYTQGTLADVAADRLPDLLKELS